MFSKPIFCAAALVFLALGCGTVDDPTANHRPPVQNDVGMTENDTSAPRENPYDQLGLPYALSEVPEGVSAPWPESAILHDALIELTHIIDGDTIRNPFSGQSNLRLHGINAPECAKHSTSQGMTCDPANTDYTHAENNDFPNEPYGFASAQALKDMIARNSSVRIACKMVGGTCERDRYDRYLVFVVVDTPTGPIDVGTHLLEQGLALTYTSFPTENLAAYCTAEDRAIAEKRGMWKDGFDAAYAAMHPDTRNWYKNRNDRCRAAQRS